MTGIADGSLPNPRWPADAILERGPDEAIGASIACAAPDGATTNDLPP